MYCDLNVLDSIIFITQMCLHQLSHLAALLCRLLEELEERVLAIDEGN